MTYHNHCDGEQNPPTNISSVLPLVAYSALHIQESGIPVDRLHNRFSHLAGCIQDAHEVKRGWWSCEVAV